MNNDEPTIIASLEAHLDEYGRTTVGQDIAAAILVIRDLHKRAVTVKPLEWTRGRYISTAKSVDTLSFVVQYIGGGDDGWMLHSYLTHETKPTRHSSREEAEAAAQEHHETAVGKYLQG